MTGSRTVLPSVEQKPAYVRQMFGRIARRYDLMNCLMTFGQDRAWRRHTLTRAAVPAGARVLDLATGTGDLALEALHQTPDAVVVGLDLTPEMLALARQKAAVAASAAGSALILVHGDALHLPFASSSFDAVVTGFALRNLTDIPAAFAEMARVARPGGRVACLEISKPRLPLFRRLFSIYFYRLVPLLGGWITGQRSAYTYLPQSLTAFLTPEQIASVMEQAGWSRVRYERLMLGTVAVHIGTRDQELRR